jgi:hypothetical protein
VRNCRATKQRLWLGPDRHCASGGNAFTNSGPKCYANGNGYAFSLRADSVADTDTDGNGDCDSYGHGHPIGDCHSHSYGDVYRYNDTNAQADTHAAICADGEASSDSVAKAIVSPEQNLSVTIIAGRTNA